MKAAILGKKLGMTSMFTNAGVHIPCSIIEAGPCRVVQIKTQEKEGYNAVQLGFCNIKEKKLNKPLKGHFDKNLKDKEYYKFLREFRDLKSNLNVGDVLTVEQFSIGDKVKVTTKSKGRGFQGVVKRHHFGGVGMITHGQSDRVRAPGSIGSSSYPSRVFKGLRMAGRMGGKTTTIRNLEIVDVIPDHNILIIKGNVPGAPKVSLLKIVKL